MTVRLLSLKRSLLRPWERSTWARAYFTLSVLLCSVRAGLRQTFLGTCWKLEALFPELFPQLRFRQISPRKSTPGSDFSTHRLSFFGQLTYPATFSISSSTMIHAPNPPCFKKVFLCLILLSSCSLASLAALLVVLSETRTPPLTQAFKVIFFPPTLIWRF